MKRLVMATAVQRNGKTTTNKHCVYFESARFGYLICRV